MRLIRRFFITLFFLLLATAIWAAVYAQRRGFSKTWRELVEAEFAHRGYYVDIGRLTLGPFQGLVAEDVRFFNDPLKRREMAFVDNVILDLDLTDVLNRDLAINTLDVKDAKLTLPVTPGRRDSELLKVDRFSARVVVTENQIEIVRAQAVLAGMEWSLKGSLFRPPRILSPAKGPALAATEEELAAQKTQLLQIRRRLDRIQTVLKQVEQFDFAPESPPRLEITFSGDLNDLAHLKAEARLRAENFRRGAYKVNRLTASAEFDGATSRGLLKELHLRDESGDLHLQGEWPVAERVIKFRVDSTANLTALASSLWPTPKLGEVVFFSPPRLAAEGSVRISDLLRYSFSSSAASSPSSAPAPSGASPPSPSPSPLPPGLPPDTEGAARAEAPPPPPRRRLPMDLSGEIHSERFGSRGAVFDGLEAQFALQGDRFYVRNLRLDHKSGVLFANFMYDPARTEDAFRYQTEIKLDPGVLSPFLTSEAVQRFFSLWHFGPESTVYLAGLGSGPSLDPSSWRSSGVVDLRRFRLNNVPFEHLESEYEGLPRTHHFRKLSVSRPEGTLTADQLSHLGERGGWQATRLQSTLDLADLVRAVAPKWIDWTERHRFSPPPTLSLDGFIGGATAPSGNDFEIRFASASQATVEFLGRPLPLDSPQGTVRAKGTRWELAQFQARLFGGEVSATFQGDSLAAGSAYRASLAVSGLSFDDTLHLYGNTERNGGGTWEGELRFAGTLGDPKSASGEGRALLREGDLLTLPLFDPAVARVSRLLAPAAPPAAAGRTGGGATAALSWQGGVLTARDLQMSSRDLDLRGTLQYDRNDRTFSSRLEGGPRSGDPPRFSLSGAGSPEAPEWNLTPSSAP